MSGARCWRRRSAALAALALLALLAGAWAQSCPPSCVCTRRHAPSCSYVDWRAVRSRLSKPFVTYANDSSSFSSALDGFDASSSLAVAPHTVALTDTIAFPAALNGTLVVIASADGAPVTFACAQAMGAPAVFVDVGFQVVFVNITFLGCAESAVVVADGASAGFRGCQFVSNRASGLGGALWVRGGVEAVDSNFVGNGASRGGAVAVTEDDAAFVCTNCAFKGNAAADFGGTIYQVHASFVGLNRGVVSGTGTVGGVGGGAFVGDASTLAMYGVAVADSLCYSDGGFAYVTFNSTLTAHNCSFANCRAPRQGGVAYMRDNSRLYLSSSWTNDTYAGACGAIVRTGETVQAYISDAQMSSSSAGRRGALACTSDTSFVYVSTSTVQKFDAIEGALLHTVGYSTAQFVLVNVSSATGRQSGGVFVMADSSAVSVSRSRFRDCGAQTQQGGFALVMSAAVLRATSSVWANITANDGGGLCAVYGSAAVYISRGRVDDVIAAGGAGGAFYVGGSGLLNVTDTTFNRISSESSGGLAYFVEAGQGRFAGCSVANTVSFSGDGGALAITGDAVLNIASTQFVYASSPGGAGGLIAASSRARLLLSYVTAEQTFGMRGGCFRIAGRVSIEISRSHFTSSSSTTSGGFLWTGDQVRARVLSSTVEGSVSRRGFGGLFMVTGESQLSLADSFFKSGSAMYSGGFAYVLDLASIRVQRSRISKMWAQAGSGGAIGYVPDSSNTTSLTIEGSYFADNTASGNGGCVYVGSPSRVYINGTTFTLCTAGQGEQTYGAGGAVFVNFGNDPSLLATGFVTIRQSSFVGNSAAVAPGVMSLAAIPLSSPFFAGNVFSNNWSPYESGRGFATPIAGLRVSSPGRGVTPGNVLVAFNITAIDSYGNPTFVSPLRPLAVRLELLDDEVEVEGELLRGFLEDASVMFANLRIVAPPGTYRMAVRSGNRLYDNRNPPFQGSELVKIVVLPCASGLIFGDNPLTGERECLVPRCPQGCRHGVCAIDPNAETEKYYCRCRFGWTGSRCTSPMVLAGLVAMLGVLVSLTGAALVCNRRQVGPALRSPFGDTAGSSGRYRRSVFVGRIIFDATLRGLDLGVALVGLLAVIAERDATAVAVLACILGGYSALFAGMLVSSFVAVRTVRRLSSGAKDKAGKWSQFDGDGKVPNTPRDWAVLSRARLRLAQFGIALTLCDIPIFVFFAVILEQAADAAFDASFDYSYLSAFAVSVAMFGFGAGRLRSALTIVRGGASTRQVLLFSTGSTDPPEEIDLRTVTSLVSDTCSRTGMPAHTPETNIKDAMVAASGGVLGDLLRCRAGYVDDDGVSRASTTGAPDDDSWLLGSDVKLRMRRVLLEQIAAGRNALGDGAAPCGAVELLALDGVLESALREIAACRSDVRKLVLLSTSALEGDVAVPPVVETADSRMRSLV